MVLCSPLADLPASDAKGADALSACWPHEVDGRAALFHRAPHDLDAVGRMTARWNAGPRCHDEKDAAQRRLVLLAAHRELSFLDQAAM